MSGASESRPRASTSRIFRRAGPILELTWKRLHCPFYYGIYIVIASVNLESFGLGTTYTLSATLHSKCGGLLVYLESRSFSTKIGEDLPYGIDGLSEVLYVWTVSNLNVPKVCHPKLPALLRTFILRAEVSSGYPSAHVEIFKDGLPSHMALSPFHEIGGETNTLQVL